MKIESRDRDEDTFRTESNNSHFYGRCGPGGWSDPGVEPIGQPGDVIVALHALEPGERTLRIILSAEEAMRLEVALRTALATQEERAQEQKQKKQEKEQTV